MSEIHAAGAAEHDETIRGRVTWASSEEGAGPDVGISVGLGQGRSLWFGEISRHLHASVPNEALGASDCGTWMVLHDERKPMAERSAVIGKCADRFVAKDACDAIAASLTPPQPAPGALADLLVLQDACAKIAEAKSYRMSDSGLESLGAGILRDTAVEQIAKQIRAIDIRTLLASEPTASAPPATTEWELAEERRRADLFVATYNQDLGYATRLAQSLCDKHFPNPEWQPLPDLYGVLTQIDNMTTGLSRTATPVDGGERERPSAALHGRAWVAAEYRVTGSPHEHAASDSFAMAQYILSGRPPAGHALKACPEEVKEELCAFPSCNCARDRLLRLTPAAGAEGLVEALGSPFVTTVSGGGHKPYLRLVYNSVAEVYRAQDALTAALARHAAPQGAGETSGWDREQVARIVFLAFNDAAGYRLTPTACQLYWDHWKHDKERAGRAWKTADEILARRYATQDPSEASAAAVMSQKFKKSLIETFSKHYGPEKGIVVLQQMVDTMRSNIRSDSSALIERVEVPFAHCCGMDPKGCDCVKPDHGTALVDRRVAPVRPQGGGEPKPDWADHAARQVCEAHYVSRAVHDVAEALRHSDAAGYTRGAATRDAGEAASVDSVIRLYRAIVELRPYVTSQEGVETWDRVNTAAIALNTPARHAASQGAGGDRERVARIIDCWAWAEAEEDYDSGNNRHNRNASLRKADAILLALATAAPKQAGSRGMAEALEAKIIELRGMIGKPNVELSYTHNDMCRFAAEMLGEVAAARLQSVAEGER